MKRVAVIGSPGAGKSTFSRKLSKKTNLPVIYLDSEHHKTDKDYYTNPGSWDNYVIQQIKKDAWIMDGNFSNTFEQRFKRADTIVFLDMPRYLTMPRITRRLFHKSPDRRPEMPEGWKERFHYQFFRYAWRFKDRRRPIYLEILKQQPKSKNIVILKAKKEIKNYFNNM